MPDYDIENHKLLVEGKDGVTKTEILAEITDREDCKTMKRRIWWEDDGVYHDGVSDLPIELREIVDNAWIEKSRKW